MTAAELATGCSVYAEIAATRIVASEDRASYLGAIDSSQPGCRHCSRVVVDDVEECPAVAHDFAL